MNLSENLRLIREIEERKAGARRSSGLVAWISVLTAGLVLFAMIAVGRRELATIDGLVTKAHETLSTKEAELRQKTQEAEAAEVRLANVRDETDEALRKAQDVRASGRDGAATVEAVVDSLLAARVAAGAPRTATGITPGPNATENRKDAVAQLFDVSPAVRVRAYAALLPQYANDATLVPEILEVARANPNNANGVYNALVVLSHMRATSLTPHGREVVAFAEQSQHLGPRVAERAQTLIGRVPKV